MTVEIAQPKCPECGFTVFNRRYVKCEKCEAELPKELVMSKEELAKIISMEELADVQAAIEAKHKNDLKSTLRPSVTSEQTIAPFIFIPNS